MVNSHNFTDFRLQRHAFTTQLTNYHTLENGVRLAFIQAAKSHKNAHKASISITLSKGHFHATDFPEGFAHLYEHMLFNASTKYQNTDALDSHLFTYHGQVNGWTQDLSSNFQLNCDQEGFLQACEILIDRLSLPLFLSADIEKEITTINAEFMSKKCDPVRQLLSVQKATCNRAHPFSIFSTGNKTTLGAKSTEETRRLLGQYHKLVMQGPHLCICVGLPPLENETYCKVSLQKLISKAFYKQKTSEAPTKPLANLPPVYDGSHLNCLLSVRHDDDRHQLITSYILTKPARAGFSENKNALYVMLCHLLESKHKQGLFYTLKANFLANDIHSYYKSIDAQTDELVVSIQLSEKGADCPLEVYSLIQAYLDFLNNKGIEEWRFREKASQYATSLHMNKGSSLLEDCIEVSQGMNRKDPLHDEIESQRTVEYFTENHINDAQPWRYLAEIFGKLRSDNARAYFISPKALTKHISEHFETPYGVSKLVPCSHKIALNLPIFGNPRQNPYMSGEHPLIRTQIAPTQLIHMHSPHINFKFYQDLRFNLPNGECYISITEPAMYESITKSAAKRVWLSCLNEFLASEFFDVELASIHFRVYAHHHGICIHTGGLSERQLLLCIELINSIRNYTASEIDIEHHLTKTIKLMQARPKQRPLNQLFTHLNEYYQDENKKHGAILKALLVSNAQEIYKLQSQYFTNNYVESLLVGNWQIAAAERFYKQLNSRFHASHSVTKPHFNMPKTISGQHIHKHKEKIPAEHFVWHFIPLLNTDDKLKALNDPKLKQSLAARSLVLEKLLSHSMFEILRQQHKMGYELGVGYKPISSYPGIAMYVVSSTHSIADIYKAMQQVIANTQKMLSINSDSEKKVSLAKIVNELINQVSPRDTDISQTANRAWLHFEDDNPMLGFEDLIEALNLLDLNDIRLALENLATATNGQILLTYSGNKTVEIEKFKTAENLVV